MSEKYQASKAGVGKLTPTSPDILGPFYRPGSPWRTRLCDDLPVTHTSLVLTGKVLDTAGKPVLGALVEFWQADPAGKYDEHGPGFRGIQAVRPVSGTFRLETVRPGDYDISPPDAPQPHEFRCSHIHVKVWVGGKDVLTTQLYFPTDQYNATDHWFDPRRVLRFTDAAGRTATFDLIIPTR